MDNLNRTMTLRSEQTGWLSEAFESWHQLDLVIYYIYAGMHEMCACSCCDWNVSVII